MNAFRFAVLLFVSAIAASFADETNTPAPAGVTTNAAPSGVTSNALPDTITIDGIIYSNVTWRTVTAATVTIFHSTGIAAIPLWKLPPDLQKQFGYDPQKVAAWQKAEQQKAAEHRAAERKTASAGLISIEDDKFLGTRSYETTSEITLKNSLQLDLRVKARAASSDSGRSPPSKVVLHFISSSSDWEFLKYHPLRFLVDGERLSWDEDEVSHDGSVGDGYVLEQMLVHLQPSQFRRLAFAKTVEGKLGISEFTIPYDKRESFRVLSDTLEDLKGKAAGQSTPQE